MDNEKTEWTSDKSYDVYPDDVLAPFEDLAIGTRFKYLDSDIIWVKIDRCGTIAKWEPREIYTGWIAQPICSFRDDNNFKVKVGVVC